MYCKCGCGELTHVPEHDHSNKGWKKGVPIDYKKGHNPKSKEPFPAKDGYKTCTQCYETKQVSEFHVQKNGMKIRASCKACERARKLKQVEARRNLVDEIKESRGCHFCKINESCVLDFHHLEPANKSRDVSEMVKNSASIEDILLEIGKCVVICANCHRRLHAGKLSFVV